MVHGLNRAKHWRKGSHWRALIRKHAQLAADDRQLVNAFSQDCRDCHVSPLQPLFTFMPCSSNVHPFARTVPA